VNRADRGCRKCVANIKVIDVSPRLVFDIFIPLEALLSPLSIPPLYPTPLERDTEKGKDMIRP
jgi:hypothetical protein